MNNQFKESNEFTEINIFVFLLVKESLSCGPPMIHY